MTKLTLETQSYKIDDMDELCTRMEDLYISCGFTETKSKQIAYWLTLQVLDCGPLKNFIPVYGYVY